MNVSTPAPGIERIRIQGSPVSVVNPNLALQAIMVGLETRRKGYICLAGIQTLTEAYEHDDFRQILERAFLVAPDGMPLVWLGKALGQKSMRRVYGPDLMLQVCERTQDSGHTHFLYGGNPGVAEELKLILENQFPGLRIVGTFCPPFRPLTAIEEETLLGRVAEARPDIIWVGIGTPKQDRFMRDYLHKLDTTLMFGVGAAFDFHTGRVKQAPNWMQHSGLEWLFRVACEPRRLAGRYFRNNPLFLWRLIKEWLGRGSLTAPAK